MSPRPPAIAVSGSISTEAGPSRTAPSIPVGSLYGYVLQGELKTENLHHDRAFLSLTFLDRNRHRLAGYRTAKIRQADTWTPLGIGPIEPRDKDVVYAVIGLHLEPGDHEDLKGAAVFDNVRLIRLPRMLLSTRNRHGIYAKASEINVDCDVSGLTADRRSRRFSVGGRRRSRVGSCRAPRCRSRGPPAARRRPAVPRAAPAAGGGMPRGGRRCPDRGFTACEPNSSAARRGVPAG